MSDIAGWSVQSPASNDYSGDPVAAIERFMTEARREWRPVYTPLIVHANEWEKAAAGKAFRAQGWYWRWPDRTKPPVALTEEEIRAEVGE